jgi:putative SOS response-associated peptidase YedK
MGGSAPIARSSLRPCSLRATRGDLRPNELAATIHDRMPVVLEPGAIDAWMRAETPADELHAMLRPCAEDSLGVHEVDRRVGKPSENDERLIVRAA